MNIDDDPILQYEVARELFNTRIAECSARIGEEQEKPVPDAGLIAAIRREQLAIALEQHNLRLDRSAEVAAAIRWHRVALAQQRERYWPARSPTGGC